MKPEELYDKLFLHPITEGDHAFNKELIRQAFAQIDVTLPSELELIKANFLNAEKYKGSKGFVAIEAFDTCYRWIKNYGEAPK